MNHYVPGYSVEVSEDGGGKAYTVGYEGQILVSEPLSFAMATQIAVDENLRALDAGHLPLAEVALWSGPDPQVLLFIPGKGYLCTGGQWKFDGIFVQMPERIAQRFCAEGRGRKSMKSKIYRILGNIYIILFLLIVIGWAQESLGRNCTTVCVKVDFVRLIGK